MKTTLLIQLFSGHFPHESKKTAPCFILLMALLFFMTMTPLVVASPCISGQPGANSALENLPPVAVCLPTPLTIFLGEDGSADLIASQLDGGSYDPEQGPLTFLTRAVSYTCSDIGPHEVTLIVLDDIGQSAECNAIVIVADNTPPVARCKNITVMPDNNGDYTLQASDIDFGSTDNCGIKSMTVTPSFVPCIHESAQQMVTLTVTDSSGNSSTCTSYVQFLGDSDCDGVGDLCDQCPGGNDQIDNNNDGFPDCAVFPGKANIPNEWYCNNKCNQKILICHIPPGNPENRHTICVSINAVPAHLAHGDYLGPCDDVSCSRDTRSSEAGELKGSGTEDILLYPNPATSLVYLDFTDHAGTSAAIAIHNNLGQIVYSRKFDALPIGQFLLPIDCYRNGLYFVSIHGSDFFRYMKLQVNRR
jgi:hypothetical protein